MTPHYTYHYSRERTETTTACCAVCHARWEVPSYQRTWSEDPACPEHQLVYRALWDPIFAWMYHHRASWTAITMEQAQDALLTSSQRSPYDP